MTVESRGSKRTYRDALPPSRDQEIQNDLGDESLASYAERLRSETFNMEAGKSKKAINEY